MRKRILVKLFYLGIFGSVVVLYILIRDGGFLSNEDSTVSRNLGRLAAIQQAVGQLAYGYQRSRHDKANGIEEDFTDEAQLKSGNSLRILLYTRRLRTPLIYEDKCMVTRNTKLFTDSKVVVFHAADFPLPKEIIKTRYLPEYEDQLWVYYNLESPLHTKHFKSHEMLFNITITPIATSDIPNGYGYFHRIEQRENIDDYISRKNKLISVYIDDCNEQTTQAYVSALQQHVDVDIYGHCRKMFPSSINCHNASYCTRLFRRYTFHLAFETSFCRDHVTDKYWAALQRGNIPVIMASNHDALIPGSFVDVKDFATVEKLARRLLFISADKNEFLKHFQWHRTYSLDFDPHDFHRTDIWLPKLCKMAINNNPDVKRVLNVSSFYGKEANCPKKYTDDINLITSRSDPIFDSRKTLIWS